MTNSLDELRLSQPGVLADMERFLPAIPAKSTRWVGEMEEIGDTFGAFGMTTSIFAGVADMYRFVSESLQTAPDQKPDLETLIRSLAGKLNN